MKKVVALAIIAICMGSIWSATCPQAQIDAGCILCDDTNPTVCTHCGIDRYLASPTCQKCPIGRTKGPDNTAFLAPLQCDYICAISCQECTSVQSPNQGPAPFYIPTCSNCIAGQYLIDQGSSRGCTPCHGGRGKPTDPLGSLSPVYGYDASNSACPVSCNSASNCDSCGADPAVCLTCPYGTYLSSTKVCLSCHSSCSKCTDAGATSCTGCNQNYYWLGGGACQACPTGTGKSRHGEWTTLTNPESPTMCYKIYVYPSGSSSGTILKMFLSCLAIFMVHLLI